LNITASDVGIYTFYDHTTDQDTVLHYPLLVIDNSSLVITAPYCCQYVWDWWLSDCHVVAPQGFDYQLDSWTFLPSGTVHDYLEIRPGTVGVSAYADNVDWQAWGVDGGVRIEGLPSKQTLEIVNSLGQIVHCSTILNPSTFIPLKTGLYLVRINNHTVKTIVK
jgi:hypothetical protein